MEQPKQLVFGPVIIEWDARYKFPIVADLGKTGYFLTQTPVTYRYGLGKYPLTIPEDYSFDGASIPWLIRIVPGLAKFDWHLLAALPHDFVCDHPELLPRSVGDGIFVSVLIALAENRMDASKKLTRLQGHLMFFAVWTWTVLTRIRNPPNNVALPPKVAAQPASTAHAPTQAEAIEVAKEVMKEETAEPPPDAKKKSSVTHP